MYVINGFYAALKASYEAENTETDLLLLEWDEQALSWADLLQRVVG